MNAGLIKCSESLMMRMLLMGKLLVSVFITSTTGILASKSSIAPLLCWTLKLKRREFLQVQNWGHYLMKTPVNVEDNLHDHW